MPCLFRDTHLTPLLRLRLAAFSLVFKKRPPIFFQPTSTTLGRMNLTHRKKLELLHGAAETLHHKPVLSQASKCPANLLCFPHLLFPPCLRCDRILSRTRHGEGNLTQTRYDRHPVHLSDHKPISATFSLQVKRTDKEKLAKVATEVSRQLDVADNECIPSAVVDDNEVRLL